MIQTTLKLNMQINFTGNKNHLLYARTHLRQRGLSSLDNPHGMIGRTCKCGTCFCCAAAVVVEAQKRLEYLRKQIHNETISYGEIAELQSLVDHIYPDDVELLEWAGQPESV